MNPELTNLALPVVISVVGTVMAILLALVGYFLKGLHADFKRLTDKVTELTSDLKSLKIANRDKLFELERKTEAFERKIDGFERRINKLLGLD